MPYPDGSQLAAYLVDAGVLASVPGDVSDYDDVMVGVSEDWCKDTGWEPFLGEAETRYYDPNGLRTLDPGAGILSLSALTIGGTAQVLNTDYFLTPYNGFPKTLVSFSFPLSGEPRSVVLTGTFGYANEVPDGVVRALLARGASLTTALLYGAGGLKREVQEGDVRYKLADGEQSQTAAWDREYQTQVRRYRRVRVA